MYLARLECDHGDRSAALVLVRHTIVGYHDSGASMAMKSPLAVLVVILDRMGRHEPAATIAGHALGLITAVSIPELTISIEHLIDTLGNPTFKPLARHGETTETSAMATYPPSQVEDTLPTI